MVKIQTEHNSFQRDLHSKALLMKDRRQAEDYKMRSKILKAATSREEELNSIKSKLSEIDTIKADMEEIKNLLKGLVNK